MVRSAEGRDVRSGSLMMARPPFRLQFSGMTEQPLVASEKSRPGAAIVVDHRLDMSAPATVIQRLPPGLGRVTVDDLVISNDGDATAEMLRFKIRPPAAEPLEAVVFLNAPLDPEGWSDSFDLAPREAHGWTCIAIAGALDVTVDLAWTEAGVQQTASVVVRIT